MSGSQPMSPQARLKALLAIPERQRTEEQWDELNELEIVLAPGNREDPAESVGGVGVPGRRPQSENAGKRRMPRRRPQRKAP